MIAVLGSLPLSLAACGSSSPSSSPTGSSSVTAPLSAPPPPMTDSPSAAPSASETATGTDTPSTGTAGATFGKGRSKIPDSRKGSFDGMSTDAVATAASNNPLLTTLVTAVKRAGLVDTLNASC